MADNLLSCTTSNLQAARFDLSPFTRVVFLKITYDKLPMPNTCDVLPPMSNGDDSVT